MREILCIAYSCPPILDPQSILLAKMLRPLRALGYRVQIIGLDPGTCLTRTDPFLPSLLPPDPQPVRIAASERRLWFRTIARLMPSLLQLPDKHLPVHCRAVRAGKALHAAAPKAILFSWAQYHSCGLVARHLKQSLGIPWVAHFSDPWFGHPFQRPRFYERWINARLEKAVISAADAIVFVTEETRDSTMARYPPAWRKKTAVIPHCFDSELYPPELRPHAGMVFRHIGHFYGDRGAGPLLEAIARLRSGNPGILEGVRFEFVGRVRADQVLEIRKQGLENLVQIRPGVGYLDSLREMREADVLLLVEAPAQEGLFLPSKLVDYLGAGRPVLALSPSRGAAARLLRRQGDRVVPPNDVAGIAAALTLSIERFRRGDFTGLPAPSEGVSALSCKTTVATLADLFDRVLSV
jgi:glycosyltransferase involved in cell wall biosynthesis